MIKIRNSVGVGPEDSRAFTGPESSRLDDISFIQKLVGRTVLPRHFLLDKGADKFEFIAQNKTIVAFKVAGAKNSVGALKGFRAIDPMAEGSVESDAVRAFVDSFGQLGDDDLLTIKRVGDEDRNGLPATGIDLAKIDFSNETPSDAKEPTLRVVVDNEREVKVKPQPVVLKKPITPPVDKVAHKNAESGILETFFDRLKAHVECVVLADKDGALLKQFGNPLEIETQTVAGLVADFCTWDELISPGIGESPKLTIMCSGKTDDEILISVVEGDRMVIATAAFMKLGRVLMGWNALVAARADQ